LDSEYPRCPEREKHVVDEKNSQSPEADAELEREVRLGRKFSLADAIGRAGGAGVMKGESAVPRLRQAELEIDAWLRSHLADGGGPFEVVLCRRVSASDLMLEALDQPLSALAAYCRRALDSDCLLEELVREVDVEWGRVMVERPRFEKAGAPSDPDDPYTVASVRRGLSDLLELLAASK
jgi:hypothetical protein